MFSGKPLKAARLPVAASCRACVCWCCAWRVAVPVRKARAVAEQWDRSATEELQGEICLQESCRTVPCAPVPASTEEQRRSTLWLLSCRQGMKGPCGLQL